MAVLAKLDVAFAREQRVAAFGSAAARLMRAFATQVEVLRRAPNAPGYAAQDQGSRFTGAAFTGVLIRVTAASNLFASSGGQAVIGNAAP
jgi:hypothetical protein